MFEFFLVVLILEFYICNFSIYVCFFKVLGIVFFGYEFVIGFILEGKNIGMLVIVIIGLILGMVRYNICSYDMF